MIEVIAERLAFDELHDDPTLLVIVIADVVDGNEIGVAKVQAVANPSHLDIEILLDPFQGDFFARVALGKVDLSKTSDSDASTDDVTFERSFTVGVLKFHRSTFAFHCGFD